MSLWFNSQAQFLLVEINILNNFHKTRIFHYYANFVSKYFFIFGKNHAGNSCEKLVWNLERYKKGPLRGFTMLLPLSQTLDPFDSCELVNLAKFRPPVQSLVIVLPPRNFWKCITLREQHNIEWFWTKTEH